MKQCIKTVICMLLSAIMTLSCTGAAFAQNSVTPVIMVHGMGATALYKNTGTDNQTQIGTFDIMSLLSDHGGLIKKLLDAATGKNADADDIINEIAAFMNTFADLACDKNGDPLPGTGIADYWADSLAHHNDYLESKTSNEPAICKQICDQIGADNVYIFNYDWRLDACENAKKLNTLIDSVKLQKNSDKVTLVSGSEGTIVVSAYIDAYKAKNDIKRTVFIDGAFEGVAVTKLFKQDLVFDYDVIMKYLDQITKTYNNRDFDMTKLTRLANDIGGGVGNLCTLLNSIISNQAQLNNVYNRVLYPVFGCIPALWEFIPYDDFDGAVAKMASIGFLDTNSGLYNKIVNYHNIQGRLRQNLNELKANGTEIAVVANYGTPAIPITSAHANQTDVLIDTRYASMGATTADYGKVLKKASKSVSPDGIIDSSTCAFPENTWFIKGIQHMDFWYNSGATSFTASLVTTSAELTLSGVKAATNQGQYLGTDKNQSIVAVTADSAQKTAVKTTQSTTRKTAAEKSPATGSQYAYSPILGAFAICAAGIIIVYKRKATY